MCKLIFSRAFFIIPFLLLAVASSCRNETMDDTDPTVSITNLMENQKVRGKITVNFSPMDEHLDKVYFFIDNVSLKTLTHSPWIMDIDTEDFEDGNHAIKVIAADANSNSSTAEVNVEFKNLMLTVEIGNSFEEGQNSYIIIYDMEGDAVDYRLIENNSTFKFPYPDDYEGWDFNATYFTVNNDNFGQSFYSETIQRCSAPRWVFPDLTDDEDYYEQNISLINVPDHDEIYASNGFQYNGIGSNNTTKLYTLVEPDNLFVGLIEGQAARYKWIPQVAAGSIEIDLTAMQEMLTGSVSAQVPVSSLYVKGNINNPGGLLSYFLSSSTNEHFFYADVFDTYSVSLRSVMPNLKTLYQVITDDLPISFQAPSFDANLTSANQEIFNFNTAGDFDYFSVYWYHYDYDPMTNYQSAHFETFGGPGDEAKYFPLPEVLKNVYPDFDPSLLVPGGISFQENNALSGYAHFSFLYNTDQNYPVPTRIDAYSIEPDPNGGRVSKPGYVKVKRWGKSRRFNQTF
jgi:hypothetical protein